MVQKGKAWALLIPIPGLLLPIFAHDPALMVCSMVGASFLIISWFSWQDQKGRS